MDEQCWILVGEYDHPLLIAKQCKRTVGNPATVDFDLDYVLQREDKRNDIIGFLHTHPTSAAAPSNIDDDTMHSWVMTLGKPLLCAIIGTDGLKGYLYPNDEDSPINCTKIKQKGSNIIAVIPSLDILEKELFTDFLDEIYEDMQDATCNDYFLENSPQCRRLLQRIMKTEMGKIDSTVFETSENDLQYLDLPIFNYLRRKIGL